MLKDMIMIPLSGIAYPFKKIGALALPFFLSYVVFTGVVYLLFEMDVLALDSDRFGTVGNTLMNLGAVLIVLLALMPLFVTVIRNIVLDEKIEQVPLKHMLRARELSLVLGWFKLIAAMLIPVALAATIVATITGVGMMQTSDPLQALAAGQFDMLANIQGILMTLSLLAMFIMMARVCMIFVTGALDRGISVRESLKLTKHRTMLVFLTLVLMVILTVLLLGLLLGLTGLIGFPLDAGELLALSHGGKLLLIAEVAFVRLLIAVMFMAAIAKLYLAVNAKK